MKPKRHNRRNILLWVLSLFIVLSMIFSFVASLSYSRQERGLEPTPTATIYIPTWTPTPRPSPTPAPQAATPAPPKANPPGPSPTPAS